MTAKDLAEGGGWGEVVALLKSTVVNTRVPLQTLLVIYT